MSKNHWTVHSKYTIQKHEKFQPTTLCRRTLLGREKKGKRKIETKIEHSTDTQRVGRELFKVGKKRMFDDGESVEDPKAHRHIKCEFFFLNPFPWNVRVFVPVR